MTDIKVGYSGLQARVNRGEAAQQTPTAPTLRTAAVDNYSAAAPYSYSLAQGNPRRLTVGQVVQEVYKVDPQKDAARYQSLVDQVARLNGLVLLNFPLPGNLTTLKMPAPPAQSSSSSSTGTTIVQGLAVAATAVTAIGGIVDAINGKSNVGNQSVPISYPSTSQSGQGVLNLPQSTNSGLESIVPAVKDAATLIDGLIRLFK
ncbi:MAG TPA: hypothetical protein DD435_08660 [Cyanobacteria bacterium UBA8530]|nr:hypothetical protein [Cyanobacteria bacterium UBA8530]